MHDPDRVQRVKRLEELPHELAHHCAAPSRLALALEALTQQRHLQALGKVLAPHVRREREVALVAPRQPRLFAAVAARLAEGAQVAREVRRDGQAAHAAVHPHLLGAVVVRALEHHLVLGRALAQARRSEHLTKGALAQPLAQLKVAQPVGGAQRALQQPHDIRVDEAPKHARRRQQVQAHAPNDGLALQREPAQLLAQL
mmetsp:Transcript_2352/g.7009  ORF Transcript_2352/g.7009 Transcript_2352/m.7009 type:complete len:200 (-) Transcript_2352:363-962(-)